MRVLCSPGILSLFRTFNSGQIFGWTYREPDEWIGVVGHAVIVLRQSETAGPVYISSADPFVPDETLRAFFQMHIDLPLLMHKWASACPRFALLAPHMQGLRLIRQDPVECLFSFITSTNNHIPRITQLLTKLRTNLGAPLGEDCFAFPTIEALAQTSEQDLRDMGFGYRAPFIVSTAQSLLALGGREFLQRLRGKPDLAREQLIKFDGVGPKVADCVALFSLDCFGVVPVDTHVLQVAKRDYDADGILAGVDSLSGRNYHACQALFVAKFGDEAGWAHSILFAAELAKFEQFLPQEVVNEMRVFKVEERTRKKQKRDEAIERKSLKGKSV